VTRAGNADGTEPRFLLSGGVDTDAMYVMAG
jgi:hypothetical protein